MIYYYVGKLTMVSLIVYTSTSARIGDMYYNKVVELKLETRREYHNRHSLRQGGKWRKHRTTAGHQRKHRTIAGRVHVVRTIFFSAKINIEIE